MRFRTAPHRRRPREAVVPMINVVFLLLIFFLMSASITPAPPFDLQLPEGGDGTEAGQADALYIDAGGLVAFGTLRGEAALAEAAEALAQPIDIRADRRVLAFEIARVLGHLRALGVSRTRLVTERQ